MPVSAGPDVLQDQLKQQIEQYDSDPSRARNTLRILLKNHPDDFCEAAAPFITGQTPAAHFLGELLSGRGLLPLCNPALLSLEEEVAIARAVMERDPLLDVKLARRISALIGSPNRGQTEIAAAQRILEILAAITDGARILPILIQVLRDSDGRLRSKAALLVGRTNKSAQWVEQVMREPDARVRANSIEALWGVDSEAVRSVLRAATKDPNNRVLGNALLGLYRLGDVSVIGRVLALAAHSAPLFRSTAAWVMGETNDPRFLPALARMIRETDAQARHSVFRAIARLKQAAARCTHAPPLRVCLCQWRRQPDGTRLVRAAVALPEGGEVPGLLPTNVVLWEDQHIVPDYTFRRTRAADSLALGVAMPAARTCPHPNGDVLEQAVRDCLGSKGPTDRWAILRFGAPRDEDAPPIDTNVLPPCFLTPEAGTLASALDNPENRYGYAEAVQSFLNTLAQSNGNRNLLLIEDRSAESTLPEIPAARWTSIVTEAQAASVAIHAIVLTPSGRPPAILASVCAQTEGICLSTSDLGQISAICERLYMGLEHPYEVVYHPEIPEAASFKLQVYCPQGSGMATQIRPFHRPRALSYSRVVNRLAALVALLLPLSLRAADGPTAEVGRRLVDAGLDPEECYQVRDLRFSKEDLRVYLTEGFLIFGKSVDGTRITAVFSGEVENGDAEVLVMPPSRAERMSLASFAQAPNLDEHFRSGVLVFTDETYAELMKQIQARGTPRKSAERGALLANEWNPVIRNFASSFQIRLVKDMLGQNRRQNGFFYIAISGRKLGNFDMLYDPQAREQISVGQVVFRQERSYFDIWTRFQARSFRNGTRVQPAADLEVASYRIDATLEPNLRLKVVTQATVIPREDSRRALAFDISSSMRLTEARINGEPAEVFQPASLRSGLIRGDQNDTFLIVPAKPVEPGREYEVEFRHEGEVITDAGNGVYFVGARGSWYPNRFAQFSRYDLTFRYPKELDLVATGKTVEDNVVGPWHVTRHRTEVPVRMAGFNLGSYERQEVNRGGYSIEVYANRKIEPALQPKRQMIVVPAAPRLGPPGNQRWTVDLDPVPLDYPEIDPAARLQRLALEIAGGLEFMSSHFGPPVLKWLTISPIPGTFGQGFPGLIYLSTLAYLDPKQRPAAIRNEIQELFYSEILHAHEMAHQWWGNVVTSASYEDDWIMEALANYSALLYLEKRKGNRAVDLVLADYKNHLLRKTESGEPLDSIGPIIWGPRLSNSQAPNAWRVITYEKGSWIMHMLRRRMGDERFLAMMGQFRRRYQLQSVNSDQFRRAIAEALPPKFPDPGLEAFFDQWVYGTGIPSLKLAYTVRGKAPTVRVAGTITQSDVSEDFSTWVPVEIQMGKGKPIVQWVRTASDPVPFSVTLKQAPGKVVLDPNDSVLRR